MVSVILTVFMFFTNGLFDQNRLVVYFVCVGFGLIWVRALTGRMVAIPNVD
jgi:hypothetical protein